jgi:magnesium transporter
MPHILFGPEVRLMLQEGDGAGMQVFLESLHPATVAETLTGDLSVEEVWSFLKHTSIRNQAAIFEYFPIDWQVKMVEGVGREHMAHLIEQMSHDDRVDLMRRLLPRVAEQLLRLVDEADRRDIANLVRQDENTAGGLMTTNYAWLPPGLTAAEALDRLRLQAPETETIYYVFVLDDQRRLLGVLSLRDLILAPRHAQIRDIMEQRLVSARAGDDREKVARVMAQYDLLAVPVVDDDGRMVGIITHDDVIDVVVEEATEDVHRMGGVAPMAENYLTAGFVTVWRKRAFWLGLLFVAELLTFWAMEYFDETINKLVVLALFLPLCISTGGNSGSQAATLITRALALGQVQVPDWARVMRHELAMGLVLGLTLGVIGFLRGWATKDEVRENFVKRDRPFQVVVPADKVKDITNKAPDRIRVPSGSIEQAPLPAPTDIVLSSLKDFREDVDAAGDKILHIPADSELRTDAVSAWRLGLVIGISVAGICLWGTLVGSMLPLVFKRLNIDPGIASSPFVATFVDVTGIIIYFSVASVYLL